MSRRLYWADWNRDEPKIEMSNMDGTDRTVLVKDDLALPNALTYDPASQQLCWADAGKTIPDNIIFGACIFMLVFFFCSICWSMVLAPQGSGVQFPLVLVSLAQMALFYCNYPDLACILY